MVTGPPLEADDANGLKGLGKMVIAGAVAVAGTQGPMLAGMSAALAIPGLAALEAVVERWRVRSGERVQALTTDAMAASGLPPAEFTEVAVSCDEQVFLAQRALTIAAKSAYEAKLHVTALAWAEAVRDPTKVDEAQLKLMSLEDLEAPHTVVLQQLDGWSAGASRANLIASLPIYESVLDPVLQTLHAAGLAFAGTEGGIAMGEFLPVTGGSGPENARWHITEWGRGLLADIRSFE